MFHHRRRLNDDGTSAIITITPDPIEMTAELKKEMQLPFTILSDPDLAVIRSFGIFHEDEPKGRTLPYAKRATYLLDRDGTVLWRHIGRETKDRPKLADLIEALKLDQ